ncbi:MAG: HAMP domain-containing sensor histidine kinase [Actinomycetaceae bacterium]|nr:HAMP domain-containing sensor histidine kinase [Actinomycetaceae bacterium]
MRRKIARLHKDDSSDASSAPPPGTFLNPTQEIHYGRGALSLRVPALTAIVVVLITASVSLVSSWAMSGYMLSQTDIELERALNNGVQSAQDLQSSTQPSNPLNSPQGEANNQNQDSTTQGNTPGTTDNPDGQQSKRLGLGSALFKAESHFGALQLVTVGETIASAMVVYDYDVVALTPGTSIELQEKTQEQISTQQLQELGSYRLARQYLVPAPSLGASKWLQTRNVSQATKLAEQQNTQVVTVIVGLPLDLIEQAVWLFAMRGLLLSLAGAMLAALVVWVIIRHDLQPLARVAAVAKEVSNRDLGFGSPQLDVRIPARDAIPNTEIGEVGQAMNTMLEHVSSALSAREASEARSRQFVADASHELRTPLASVAGYSELLSQLNVPPDQLQAITRIRSEAGRMSYLVEDLLLLARLDSGRPLERELIDISAVLIDSVADAHVMAPTHAWVLDIPALQDETETSSSSLPWFLMPIMEAAGQQSHISAAPPATVPPSATEETPPKGKAKVRAPIPTPLRYVRPVWYPVDETQLLVVGDDARLRQIVANLLSNARQHTPAGTKVTLAGRLMRSEGRADHVAVWVHDEGPGILPEVRGKVFDRFARADSARSSSQSTGLGLSIVKAVTQAHGGTVRLLDDPVGSGTTFEIWLPAAPQS